MKRPFAMIGGTAKPASSRRRPAMLLATASAIALLCGAVPAAAAGCGGAPPSDVASPSALYDTLRDRTDAQLLAIGFVQQPADCAWVYEVKVLTVSGSVVELDFAARGLGLIGARGPDDDKEVARLVRGLGGNPTAIVTGNAKDGGNGQGAPGDNGGGEGGEGGSSGSGSGGSGSGSGSGSGGGGDDGGGSEGGEGGNSGSGGGGDDGGGDDGGEGGNSGSGSDGSGGEGGDD